MADTEEHPPTPNEFHSRLTSPKHSEQVVGTEMHNHNGGLLAFKVYPKAWDDHHGSTERFDIPSPQIDPDDEDEEEGHVISKGDRLKHSINLPPMSPTMLSPPAKYIPSQDFSQSMPALNGESPFKDDKSYPFVCSYQKAIDENPLSPTTEIRRNRCERVIDEIIATEHSYINDLSQIITGYQEPMVKNIDMLGVSDEDVIALFNNIEEIRDFNEFQLKRLKQCKDDVKQIARCFINIWQEAEGSKIYSDYCTKYPKAVEVWGKFAKHSKVMNFFKRCQQKLGHMLPLFTYLLKPVQRVLKYYLLLEKIDACLMTGEEGKEEIKAAVVTMTEVGDKINEVKKKYEATVKIQEIQAQLDGWEGDDLTTYGDLVCQDTFRFLGGKPVNAAIRLTTERYLFLFQRLLLMTKKKEEHYVYKQHINISDLQLHGNIPKYPSCFQIRQISTTRVFTFQARTQALKEEWVQIFNKILVDSVADTVDMDIPNKEKLLWFAGIKTDFNLDTKKKRNATLDVTTKKVQKSSSFRRQNTPYDHHKSKPVHRGRAESPDEAQFRSRAHTTANSSRSLHRTTALPREIGYSHLPDANKQELDVTSHSTQRSKSLHTSPLNDGGDSDDDDNNKLKLVRRSSDTTSPTLLSDDEDEIVKVVKRDFQTTKHHRHNAVKRRSTPSLTSPPPMSPTSPTSASSDDPAAAALQGTLPPPELAELRSISRNSNHTSISSAASCEDIQMIRSPEHPALPNDNNVNEFPSVEPPAGHNLHLDTSMALSTSDIYLNANTSVSNVQSPTIFIDIFDGEDDDRASPTAELCAADNTATDDIILDASTNQVISKLDDPTSTEMQSDFPDIDMLSQEILNEISMVGMSLNEEQFSDLPDDYPVNKHNQHSDLSTLDQIIFKHDRGSDFTSSSNPNQKQNGSSGSSLDTFPTALPPSRDSEGSRLSVDTIKSSPNNSASRLRYQDAHQHKTIASKVASEDSSQYYVHISPYASDSDSPKSTKRINTNSITSHPLHNSRESPKSERQKHHSSPPSTMEPYWRDVSPQLSDEPNEEFVLPPPPQFQGDDNTMYPSSSSSLSHQTSAHDVTTADHHQGQKAHKRPLGTSSSSSQLQDNVEKSTQSTTKLQRTLKSSRANYSTSHLMDMGNMDEEVLLTDMLKSLDQMAEKKYHDEMEQRNSLKERRAYTAESKAEKSEKKKQKKKAIKRRSTVGIYNFDDLIKQSIQENRPVRDEEYPQQPVDDTKVTDDSKVRKLAREYSKRVRDRQMFNIKKRFSVHSYENFSGSEPNTPEAKHKEPSWKTAADTKRETHRVPPSSPAPKRLPTIVSGSADIGVPARTDTADCTIVSNDYTAQSPTTKFNKYKSSPVMMRSSSPIRSRIEGFEKLSQSRDDYPIAHRSESANPMPSATRGPSATKGPSTTRGPSRGKSFTSGVSHVKSQENINTVNHQSSTVDQRERSKRQKVAARTGQPLNSQSRELSKSHGSLNPLSTNGNSKSYRGLSIFSPETLDESNIIYKPGGPQYRDDFEHIRNRGGFKGWVKNLVDKFSK